MREQAGAAISPETTGAGLSSPLRKLWIVFSCIALLLWLLYFAAVLHVIPKGFADIYPGGTASGSAFEDLFVYKSRFDLWHTSAFFDYKHKYVSTFAYPPVCALIYAFIYKLPRGKVSYLLMALTWGSLVFFGAWRSLARRMGGWRKSTFLALSSVLFCFPYTFLVQRGNIELFLWMLVVLGAAAYLLRRPYTAAAMFGLAAAMKIYPVVLLAIFLRRRLKVGPLLCGLGVTLTATLFAIWYTGPSISFAATGFLHGVTNFQSAYANTLRSEEIRFDHSLFGLAKLIGLYFQVAFSSMIHPYYAVCGLIATTLYLLRVRWLPFHARFTFLSTAMVLLPPVSYEYTLVHLLLPLLMLVLVQISNARTARPRWQELGTIACLLCVMLPITLFRTRSYFFAGQLQAFLLLVIFLVLASLPRSDEGEPEESYAIAAGAEVH